MDKFYKYRRYSYMFFILCVICGLIITKNLSKNTHDAIEQRLSILPTPVYSNSEIDTDTIKLTTNKNTVKVLNTGKYDIYMIELDAGGEPVIFTDKVLRPGDEAEIVLDKKPEKPAVISVGINK